MHRLRLVMLLHISLRLSNIILLHISLRLCSNIKLGQCILQCLNSLELLPAILHHLHPIAITLLMDPPNTLVFDLLWLMGCEPIGPEELDRNP